MKTTIFTISIAFILVIGACKKEKTEDQASKTPTPTVNITFGYSPSFSGLTAYINQNEIKVDSVTAHDYFGVSIVETNLSSFYGFTTDSGIIEYDATTLLDKEHFHNRKNINVKTSFLYNLFGVNEFGSEMFLPYKISSVAVKGNDTLEISNTGDFVKINYQSHYSGLLAKDSISIKP